MSKHPYEILVRPLLSEKANMLQSLKHPQYTFEVRPDSNKVEIRHAIERAFKVKVTAVATVLTKGKVKRARTGRMGGRPDVKKAIVTLAEGQSINLI